MAQAKAKSNSVVTTLWAPIGNRLQITVIGAGIVDFDAEKASESNRAAAEKHGWTQRLCDRAAKGRDPKTGKPATPQVKFEAIKELAEYYMSGDVSWKMSGGGGGDAGLLLTALCRLRPDRTVEQVGKFLDSRTKEQLQAVRARKDVVEEMNKVRLERAGDVDASDALDELDAMEGEGDSEEEAEIG